MSSEQDVDRELKAALSVSPRPDFEARVLQRVEADRPTRWPAHYGWLAAAASLVIAAGVFSVLNHTSAVVPPAVPQVVERRPPAAVVPQPEAPVRKTTETPPRIDIARVSRRAPRSTEPEVLVPPDQMEAVRRLVRAVNEGRIEVPAEPLEGPMTPIERLGVAPLIVEPIRLSPIAPATETATPVIRGLK